MEQDALKSAWQAITSQPKSAEEVQSMMRENKHPVLKNIRKQMIIESVAFTVFLFIYYDFFDGDRKPVYVNILLVIAVLFIMVHNSMGYLLTNRRIKGDNIKQSLEGHLVKMKMYAVVSVVSRVLFAGCLLFFFTSVIVFNAYKYWMLVAVIGVFVMQIVVLAGIWMKRIRQLKRATDSFCS